MAHIIFCTFIVLILASCEAARPVEQKTSEFPTPRRPISLILTDIDGTLTKEDYKFVDANIEGFLLARKLGIDVGVVTGRDPEYVRSFFGNETLRKLNYNGSPGIYLNGTLVLSKNGDAIVDAPFDQKLKERLLRTLDAHGVKEVKMGTATKAQVHVRGASELQKQHYTLFSIDEKDVLDGLRTQLENEFGDEVIFTRCHPNALGLHSAGFDKGTAVQVLANDLGISLEEVLVMGDAENDLPMFGIAGISVAVGNAQDALKKKADYITVDSSEGALLAVIKDIERLGLYPGASSQAQQSV